MTKFTGLIPAAGKGVRAQPYTHETHKGMLDINGTPNLERIISVMRDQLDIYKIVIIIGHLGESIKNYFGDGSQLHVSITYVENSHLEKGLAYSIFLAQEYIDTNFCIMLCDECYISSNHQELLHVNLDDNLFYCAGLRVDETQLIRNNYAIHHSHGKIQRLIEKPQTVESDIMGSGTFVCKPELLSLLGKEFQKDSNEAIDFIGFLDKLVQEDRGAKYFELDATYVNINDRDSLYRARYHDRDKHFSDYDISLLIYAEGDEKNIAFTIERYKEIETINKIYVVLPQTSKIEQQVLATGANIIYCPERITLYGERLHFAAKGINSDIVIFTEADYSFPNRDVNKLLTYLREADLVIGTRTTRQLIEQGSTMRGIVRLANSFLGKLIELFWWNRETRLTDVGCTFRAFWRSTFVKIESNLQHFGPEYSAEMIIECLNTRQRVIEVPVNYYNQSRSLHRAYQHPNTFWRFLRLIVKKRFTSLTQHTQ